MPWGDGEVHVLRSLDDVAALKETDGGEIHVHGSPTLAQGLAAAGLVDRYHLLVFPVLLGSGKRLFVDGTDLDKTSSPSPSTPPTPTGSPSRSTRSSADGERVA